MRLALIAACLVSAILTMASVSDRTEPYCGDVCQPVAEWHYVHGN